MNAKRIVNTDPHPPVPADTIGILETVIEERDRAMQKWDVQNHPDGTEAIDVRQVRRDLQRKAVDKMARDGVSNWYDILLEEVYEAGAEEDLVALDKELTQVMQVCLVWREDLWRRMVDQQTVAVPAGEVTAGVADADMYEAMKAIAATWLSKPALVDFSKGGHPGRNWLQDNINALLIVVGAGVDRDNLFLLKNYVKALPASWWDVNFTPEEVARRRHDREVAAALTNPLPGRRGNG